MIWTYPKINTSCGGYDMENINNNFDERLKKYSEKIKSMEIVYRDGRVKCINNKNIIDLKRNNIKDKSSYIRSEKLKKKL